jgi:hypothetical protein
VDESAITSALDAPARTPGHSEAIMSPSIDDDEKSEASRYAKRLHEQPLRMPGQDRLKNSEFVSDIDQMGADLQRRMAAAPRRRENSALAMIGRIAGVILFVALVALLVIFAKPLWQSARALLNADSQTLQASKPSDRLTANNAPPNSPLNPATKIS